MLLTKLIALRARGRRLNMPIAVTVFTIGNEGLETLSTYIYADARKGGLTPELRPLSTIIFVLVLVLLVIINRRAGKKKEV